MLLLLSALPLLLIAQEQTSQIACSTQEDPEWIWERDIITQEAISSASTNTIKHIRINIHFMLRTNGTGNFTETDNGFNDGYSGYEFAHDLLDWVNGSLSWNQKMILPPGNNTPVDAKNIRFIINNVYFHRNDNTYNSPVSMLGTYRTNPTEVMDIFFTGSGSYTYQASTPNQNSTNKYIIMGRVHEGYVENRTLNGNIEWFFHTIGFYTIHEVGHLLGLSHTVRYNNGNECPTVTKTNRLDQYNQPLPPAGYVDTNCDDGCADTPTAWYIADQLNLGHPACRYNAYLTCGCNHCSNNAMDYGGGYALTPCQLGIIHYGLDNGLRNYRVCENVKNTHNVCTFTYPQVAAYGANLIVGACAPSTLVVQDEYKELYFSQTTELSNLDVQFSGQDDRHRKDEIFEVFFVDACY